MKSVTGSVEQLQTIENQPSTYSEHKRWQEFSHQHNHSIHFITNSEDTYILEFDTECDPPHIVTDGMDEKTQAALEVLINTADQKLGEIINQSLVIRLKNDPGHSHGKLCVIPLNIVRSIINSVVPQPTLTNAETRTLLQLVCGYTLKETAAVDQVSYETKRVQVKSLLAKSRMKRQIDLCNHIVARLLLEVKNNEFSGSSISRNKTFIDFIKAHIPTTIRTHTVLDPKGNTYRYLDIGPQTGKISIVLHAHFLPFSTGSITEILNETNERQIWPLRNGMLSLEDDALSPTKHTIHAIAAIEQARKLFCTNNQSVSAIALGCAAHYAIAYAEVYPGNFEDYTFVGAPDIRARKFISTNMALDDTVVISNPNNLRADYMISLACRTLVDSSHLRKLLIEAFASSPLDRKFIESRFSIKRDTEAMKQQFEISKTSIEHDCNLHMAPDWNIAKIIKQPIKLIYGLEDGIVNIDQINRIGEQLGAAVIGIPRAGNLLFQTQFKHCLKAISNRLESVNPYSKTNSVTGNQSVTNT